MALLTNPHWEVIPSLLRELLIEIGQQPFSRRFYLAGGTALALRLGHRVSVDLDFFSQADELLDDSRAEIVAALRKRRVVRVLEDVVGNLLLEIESYHVGFFGYGYSLLEPPDEALRQAQDGEAGVRVGSLADVGLMKLDAIADRGARKDFYDAYFISRRIPLDSLLDQSPIKYPYTRGYGMMVLEGMVDFDRADQQAPVQTNPPVAWETIKEFFVQELRRIGGMWFEPEG